MPTVPRLTDRVDPGRLQAPKLDTTAPLESFGGGRALNESTHAIQGLGKTVQDILKEESKKSNDLFAQEKRAEILQKKNALLWDHASGAYNRKGKDALGVVDEYGRQFSDFLNEVEGSAVNEEQRVALRKIRLDIETEFQGQLQKHTFGEVARFDEESTRIAIANEIQDGVQNWNEPGKDKRAIDNIAAMTRAHAARQGKPPEWVQKTIQEGISNLYSSRIQSMLAQGQDELAEIELKQNGHLIFTKDRDSLDKVVSTSRREGDAKRSADKLWAETGGDYEAATQKAQSMFDHKAYPLVKKWLKEKNDSKEGIEKRDYDKLYQDASNFIYKSKEMPANAHLLKPEHRRALEHEVARLKRGDDASDDLELYYNFRIMAAHSATRDTFKKTDLKKYRDKFKPETFKKLVETQANLYKDDKSFDPHGILSSVARTERALEASGIKNPKDKALFQQRVDEIVIEHEKRTGKRASQDEIQKIVDDQIKDITINKSFLFIPYSSTKPKFKYSIKEFSKDEVDSARKALQSQGAPTSDEWVVEFLTRTRSK